MELSKDKKLVIISIFVGILVIGLWSLTLLFSRGVSESTRGTFGDMFGAVNALFSGLAFAGIIFTILLQREELSLQRLELQETRNELKRSADSQERSERAAINQQNQTTFFNLLEHQKKLVETIKLNNEIGFNGIRQFAKEIRKNLISYMNMEELRSFHIHTDTGHHPSNALKDNKSAIIGYLKNIETIIEFIETNLSNKKLFHAILYNYMSVPEKYLLGIFYYYDCESKANFLINHTSYLEYYETNLEKYKNQSDKYFPNIKIYPKGYKHIRQFELESINPLLELCIKTEYNYFEKSINLIDINFSIKSERNNDTSISESIFFNSKIAQTANTINVDISDVIKRKAFLLEDGNHFFKYFFIFNYDDRNYSILYQHKVFKTSELQFNEEGDYYDETRYALLDFD